jgi:zinc protease
MSKPVIDRSGPPAASALRTYRFPTFVHQRLECGIDAYVGRLASFPLVSLELLFPAGAHHDRHSAPGLATLTGALLDEGTSVRSSMEIASTIEHLGGQLGTGADWDAGYIAAGMLAPDLDQGLELLAEIALEPSFPAAEVERVRRLRLAEILRRRHMPEAISEDLLLRVLYDGTVYATSLLGSAEALSQFERQELIDFYRGHYGLQGAALVAVGDLEPEHLIARVEHLFEAGKHNGHGSTPAVPDIRPPQLPGVVVHIFDRAEAAQTELRMGHVGVSRTNPDYTALVVLNTLLGGKFTSRINLNLRERHGYTYGASSRFTARKGAGPFVVSAAVATESVGAATREVLGELRRIREELVTPNELDDTRNYLLGVFPYTMQTVDDLVGRLEDLAVHSLPDDHYERLPERLAATSREDLLAVAQRHLHPEALAIIAVGPAATLTQQLEGLGIIHVHDNATAEAAAVPAASPTPA